MVGSPGNNQWDIGCCLKWGDSMKENLTIGFIGNLNCGKITLFNAYTGVNLKVAN